jgi:hypothetical protein
MLKEKFFPVLSASKVTFLIALFKVAPAASDGLTPNNVVAGVVLVVPVALDSITSACTVRYIHA